MVKVVNTPTKVNLPRFQSKYPRPELEDGGATIPGAAPAIPNDPVAAGRLALDLIRNHTRTTREMWTVVGVALLAGRRATMEAANAKKPAGKKYNEMFAVWVEVNGFSEIDPSDRRKLMAIAENREDVEYVMSRLSFDQNVRTNHPSKVWHIWKCKDRGQRWLHERDHPEDLPETPAPNLETAANELDAENEELKWQRGLLLRARKAIGDAKIELWALPEPPDEGLRSVVRKAAEQWAWLAEYLDDIRNATADELAEARAGRATTKSKLKQQSERKTGRWRRLAEQTFGAPNNG